MSGSDTVLQCKIAHLDADNAANKKIGARYDVKGCASAYGTSQTPTDSRQLPDAQVH